MISPRNYTYTCTKCNKKVFRKDTIEEICFSCNSVIIKHKDCGGRCTKLELFNIR